MPPEQGACKHDWQPAIVEGRPWEHCSKCGGWAYTGRHTQECATCPLEGRVVALEARVNKHKDYTCLALGELEARLHALELAIITDVAEIEKLKTLAEQGTDLFEEHDERLQALERPAAPAQRQPLSYLYCHECLHYEVDKEVPPCVDCKQHWQPRQGAGQ